MKMPPLPPLPDARYFDNSEPVNYTTPYGTVTADPTIDSRLFEPSEMAMYAIAYGRSVAEACAKIADEHTWSAIPANQFAPTYRAQSNWAEAIAAAIREMAQEIGK